jgi:glycerate dehydrogenase
MRQVVFLDSATIADGISIPPANFEHEWTSFNKTNATQTLKRAQNADLIITNKVAFNKELLSQLPQLKHIAIAATGTNCVDLVAAREFGIEVSNVPGYATCSASEHVMAMILSLRRNLLAFQSDIATGKWQASQQFCFYNNPILDLYGSTLGLIGTGAIAQQVASVAKAFGIRVIFHSVSGRKMMQGEELVSLNYLLENSDIVSLHCPLTPATENLINAQRLNLMRHSALLINTARGSVVDLNALHQALLNKKIAGAGIDVAPQEPPPSDSIMMQLNTLLNCIVTPHTAWASQQSSQALVNQIVANLKAFVEGQSINIVN